MVLNRRLTSLPAPRGTSDGLGADCNTSIQRTAASVDTVVHHVHVEIFIMAWDETTDVFFTALARAAARGGQVRVLVGRLGSRKYPGFPELIDGLSGLGIAEDYERVSLELTRADWTDRPGHLRYLDNVMRVTSALQWTVTTYLRCAGTAEEFARRSGTCRGRRRGGRRRPREGQLGAHDDVAS